LLDNRIEKKKVEMNYRNYEGKIVEKYGVELKGWPDSKSGICNPATLGGRQQLEKLLAALESGHCHWVVLSEDELNERKKYNQAREERGEQVYRPRKSANHHRGAKSAETIDDEESSDINEPTSKRARDDDDDDDEEDEDNPEHATKRSRNDTNTGIDNTAFSDQHNTDIAAIGHGHNTDSIVAIGHGHNTDIAAIGHVDDQDNTDTTTIAQEQSQQTDDVATI
jgi:hypothetical protein